MDNIHAVVGRRIADARRRRGWQQRDLATRINRSESWVSQVERGVTPLDSIDLAARIADVLGLDLAHLIALDRRTTTSPADSPKQRRPERRSVILGSMLAAVPTFSRAGALSPESAADLRTTSAAYRRAYRELPARALLPVVQHHLGLITSLNPAAQPEPIRLDLLRQHAEMAGLAAVLLMLDLDDYEQADTYLTWGASAAVAADDPERLAVLHGVRAFHAAYAPTGSPHLGVDWATAACDVAPSHAHRTTAWVHAVASEMHASVGADRACGTALDTSRTALDSDKADRPWAGIGAYDASKADAYEGGDLLRLGRHQAAITWLTAALDRLGPDLLRHRCTALIDRADAYRGAGDLSTACTDATAAVEIVAETGHHESVRRLLRFHQSVRAMDTVAVRQFTRRLTEVRAQLRTTASAGGFQ